MPYVRANTRRPEIKSPFIALSEAGKPAMQRSRHRGCQMWLSNALGPQPFAENPLSLLVIPAGVEPAFPT